MSKSRRQQSRQWHARHESDTYVKQARKQGYRSRAAHKLEAIDRQERLLRPGLSVLDLGAAPGSWSQYVTSRIGRTGRVIAVDRLAFDPLPGVDAVLGDITEPDTIGAITDCLPLGAVDLVISDMAPNISGVSSTDEARFSEIFRVLDSLCDQFLRPGGNAVVKVFEGQAAVEWQKTLKTRFSKLAKRKPPASRDRSREMYVVARGFVGQGSATGRS